MLSILFYGNLLWMINVEVTKQSNENSMGTIRRFTRRVQGSGVLKRVRSIKFYKRNESKFIKKNNALNKIAKREKYEELLKLGKIVERKGRQGRRR